MAVVQDIYNSAPGIAFPGMVADGETSNRISRTVEDAGGIAFGSAVFRGAGDRGCTATVGTLATFLGWTIAEHGQPLLPGGVAADIIPRYRSLGILTLGAIFVNVKGTVNDGDAITIGKAGGAADLVGATPADATHIATGWFADDTVTDGICRIYRR